MTDVKRKQCRDLIAWFDSGMDITVIGAAVKLGIGALPRRISDLEEQGYPIHREWQSYVNSKGELKRRMHYSKWFKSYKYFDVEKELENIDKAFDRLKSGNWVNYYTIDTLESLEEQIQILEDKKMTLYRKVKDFDSADSVAEDRAIKGIEQYKREISALQRKKTKLEKKWGTK